MERAVLLDGIETDYGTIVGKFSNTVTAERKRKTWKGIQGRHYILAPIRTPKWIYIKLNADNCLKEKKVFICALLI